MVDDPLALLRDVHLPAEPGWWPPALLWWLTAIGVVLASALLAPRLRRAWARVRTRRAALRALAAIEQRRRGGAPGTEVAAEISMLLRRVALTRHPRTAVAGLTGERWMTFLERGTSERGFTDGPGRSLLTAPYGGEAPCDLEPLVALARRWIRGNAGPLEDA